ncbi:hypothetical protein C0J52_23326 [Blattella germanica]|nr:hypothetical protein C0J52_23326 [Blattella germanica]
MSDLRETSSLTSQSSHNLSTDSAVAPAQKSSSTDREEITINSSQSARRGDQDKFHQSTHATVPLQEPDVIASTKSSNVMNGLSLDGSVETSVPVPIAPPRRKKKTKQQTPRTFTKTLFTECQKQLKKGEITFSTHVLLVAWNERVRMVETRDKQRKKNKIETRMYSRTREKSKNEENIIHVIMLSNKLKKPARTLTHFEHINILRSNLQGNRLFAANDEEGESTPPPKEEAYSQSSPLPSPASTIESLTREFEHSLDIRSATKGQYVVKPQVSLLFYTIIKIKSNLLYHSIKYIIVQRKEKLHNT